MAKTQSFGDKAKRKKVQQDKILVKVIQWYKDDNRGSLRAMEKLVGVKDINEVDKISAIKEG